LLLNADEADGRPFLVMEYVVGENLSWLVKRKGPLPVGDAVEFIRQAAVGLQHAFERNVIHRDMKPGNLLLTKSSDEKPLVKIMDFGLARLDSDVHNVGRLTHAGNILGTIDYIAPEQAEDSRAADIRADIYGLGCSLYFLLAGKPPFPGSTVVEKLLARQENEPPSVRAERPEVPAGLDAVLRRMMARNPQDRFQSPVEASQALAPFTRITQGEMQTLPMSQADLAAALTARQLAQAIPVKSGGHGSAPVAQAWIVAEPTDGSPGRAALPALAMAQPIGAPHGVPPDQRTEFPWSRSTHPEAAPLEARPREPAATSNAPPTIDPRKKNLLLWGGIGAAALVIVLLALLLPGRGTPPPVKAGYFNPGAALTIMPLDPITFKEGDSKFLIVQVIRKEFSGPVKVHFDNLPEGVSAGEIKIDAKKDIAELRLTVSFGAGAMKRSLRLVAVAENLRDETTVPLTVTRNRNVRGGD
jgi:protein kinase-like protein